MMMMMMIVIIISVNKSVFLLAVSVFISKLSRLFPFRVSVRNLVVSVLLHFTYHNLFPVSNNDHVYKAS